MTRPPLNDKNSTTGLIGIGSIPGQAPVASFNIDGVNNLLDTKGFLAWQYIHCLNPIKETIAGPVKPDNQAAIEGVQFYSVRAVKIVPMQFKVEETLTVQGIWGQGTAMFNIGGHYLDGAKEQTHVNERDLIVFNSAMTDKARQLIEFNPTGPQKLHYKAVGLDLLKDSRGNIYQEGTDFALANGQIAWTKNGRKPGFHNGKGDILTVVYWHNPIYIVVQRPHSIRVIPSNMQGHGAFPRDKVYAPQLLIVRPTTAYRENEIMNYSDIPPIPEYADSKNTTGGST